MHSHQSQRRQHLSPYWQHQAEPRCCHQSCWPVTAVAAAAVPAGGAASLARFARCAEPADQTAAGCWVGHPCRRKPEGVLGHAQACRGGTAPGRGTAGGRKGLGQQQRCRGREAPNAEGGCCMRKAVLKKRQVQSRPEQMQSPHPQQRDCG